MAELAVPSWRMKEEAGQRREADARCESENQALRIAIVALGADPKEIVAESNRSLPLRCPEGHSASQLIGKTVA